MLSVVTVDEDAPPILELSVLLPLAPPLPVVKGVLEVEELVVVEGLEVVELAVLVSSAELVVVPLTFAVDVELVTLLVELPPPTPPAVAPMVAVPVGPDVEGSLESPESPASPPLHATASRARVTDWASGLMIRSASMSA